MPLDFTALTAEVSRLETTAQAVVAAVKTPPVNPADQASIDAAATSLKASNDAIAAALPTA
jgi:hypothetical protein